MQLSKNFYLSELTASATATKRGISNTPPPQHLENMKDMVLSMLQPLRDAVGAPIIITSGYRSKALNRAIGGSSSTSAHTVGYAIDLRIPSLGNTREQVIKILDIFRANGIRFDQTILEFPDSAGSWIHLGFKHPNGAQRGQVLTAVKRRGKTVYLEGLH